MSEFKQKPLYRGLAHLRQTLAARDSECFKKPYETQGDAEHFAAAHQKKHGRQRPYLCWCGNWHLTSQ